MRRADIQREYRQRRRDGSLRVPLDVPRRLLDLFTANGWLTEAEIRSSPKRIGRVIIDLIEVYAAPDGEDP